MSVYNENLGLPIFSKTGIFYYFELFWGTYFNFIPSIIYLPLSSEISEIWENDSLFPLTYLVYIHGLYLESGFLEYSIIN